MRRLLKASLSLHTQRQERGKEEEATALSGAASPWALSSLSGKVRHLWRPQ